MKFILLYIVVVNLITFLIYGADKRRAIRGTWRVKENTLIGLAVIGGSVGALLGMQIFHHKTKHWKFTVGVPVMIALQIFIVLLVKGYLKL